MWQAFGDSTRNLQNNRALGKLEFLWSWTESGKISFVTTRMNVMYKKALELWSVKLADMPSYCVFEI